MRVSSVCSNSQLDSDQVAQLEKEKEALRLEALAAKDQFAAKQSQFARLFEELTDTRDQLATSVPQPLACSVLTRRPTESH